MYYCYIIITVTQPCLSVAMLHCNYSLIIFCINCLSDFNCFDSSGICGSPRLADVGGLPYLLPLAQKDKVPELEVLH